MKEKYYLYADPAGMSDEPVFHIAGTKAILALYWESWKKKMENNGLFRPSDVGLMETMCVEDFVVIHFAQEVDESNIVECVFHDTQDEDKT